MNKYFAPLEGITGYIFRNTFDKYYGGLDKYFAPFMSPADNCAITPKERRDVTPLNNEVGYLVPQILTKKSWHFMDAAEVLIGMGYKEINLNLGCPSGTVCAKGKGSGFLSETYELDCFLSDIYEFADKNNIYISIKTRVGRYEEEEWEELLAIYNKYPIYELIIHPRVGMDYYKGSPRMTTFKYAVSKSVNPIVYNGDILTVADIENIKLIDNKSEAIMIGRGLLRNPELLCAGDKAFDYRRFLEFHNELFDEYRKILSPDKNILFKMKELWTYWASLFNEERMVKNILKAKRCDEYELEVKKLIKEYL